MPIATLCYIKKQGKTLMLHRSINKEDMHKDKWVPPGGKMNDGESPEQCVIREVKEESGLTIKNPIMKGILTFPAGDKYPPKDWYVFAFIVDKFEGVLKEKCKEGYFKWVDDDKLLDLPLWEGDKIFMKWLSENKFFSATFRYQGNELVDHSVVFH